MDAILNLLQTYVGEIASAGITMLFAWIHRKASLKNLKDSGQLIKKP